MRYGLAISGALLLLGLTGCGAREDADADCAPGETMQVAIGQVVYKIPARAGVSPEDAEGLIVRRRSKGAARYCQHKDSAFIRAREVYFDVPGPRDKRKNLIHLASVDSRTPGPDAAPRWMPIRSHEIAQIGIGQPERPTGGFDTRLPITIRLKSGRVQEISASIGSYPDDGWIALCRMSLPLADGNILEVSTGGVPANATDPIGQDIINGLRQAEQLERSALPR